MGREEAVPEASGLVAARPFRESTFSFTASYGSVTTSLWPSCFIHENSVP
jgi:hypothetical protein